MQPWILLVLSQLATCPRPWPLQASPQPSCSALRRSGVTRRRFKRKHFEPPHPTINYLHLFPNQLQNSCFGFYWIWERYGHQTYPKILNDLGSGYSFGNWNWRVFGMCGIFCHFYFPYWLCIKGEFDSFITHASIQRHPILRAFNGADGDGLQLIMLYQVVMMSNLQWTHDPHWPSKSNMAANKIDRYFSLWTIVNRDLPKNSLPAMFDWRNTYLRNSSWTLWGTRLLWGIKVSNHTALRYNILCHSRCQ